MKKLFKSKIFWFVIILLVIGGIAGYRLIFTPKPIEYLTQAVSRGTIFQTVSATGKIKPASEVLLNFKNSGRISSILVKIGDKVKKDQVLARQRANDLQASVDKARANLIQAQANYDKIKAGATSQDIAVYEAAFSRAQSDLSNAQSDLESTKSTYTQTLDNKRISALSDINAALAKVDLSLQKVYEVLNYDGRTNSIMYTDPALEQISKNSYEQSKVYTPTAKNDYAAAQSGIDLTTAQTALDSTGKALDSLSSTLNNFSRLLNTAVVSSSFTQTELDTLKSIINAEWLTTNTSITTIKTASQNLNDAKLNYDTRVQAAENVVQTNERNLARAQADLNYKKAPARPEDIRLAQAQVLSAQADLSLALDRMNDTVIMAPIDGVVTAIDGEAGEVSSPATPVIKLLTNSVYEIEVDIPESDIIKINPGDLAEVTLDAFSSDEVFKGSITKIDPAETSIQDVIYYKVTVTLDAEQPAEVTGLIERIKPGMTANVQINTAQIDQVLIVPTRAVKEEDGIKYVEVLENEQPRRVDIVTGLRGDEGKTEVKSGLSEGQLVITFVRK